mmetsp:Transcript_37801/g.116799  ORF Transcript_37801/g.116799 Transcript_37801/m.116799 type:complete len:755 (+) Transcript_37801:280-2544(+)
MRGEGLQVGVVGVHELARVAAVLVARLRVVVRPRRVDAVVQDAPVAVPLAALDEPRRGEPVRGERAGVGAGDLEEGLEVGVVGVLLVARLAPRLDGRPVVNEHLEEGVEQQRVVGGARARVERHGPDGLRHGVAEERRVNHDDRVVGVGLEQQDAVDRRLVGRVVEHVDVRRPPQVEHEEREVGEMRRELQRLGLVLRVVPEAAHEPDHVLVDPPQHVEVLRALLGTVNRDAGEEHRRRHLVERLAELREVRRLRYLVAYRDDADALRLALLVPQHELCEAARLVRGLLVGRRHAGLEEDGVGAAGVDVARGPLAGAAEADLGLRDAGGALAGADALPDDAGDLEGRRRVDVHRGVEPHGKRSRRRALEEALDGGLELAALPQVGRDEDAAGGEDAPAHLGEADLVEAGADHVQRVPLRHHAPHEAVIEGASRLIQRRALVTDVGVRPDHVLARARHHGAGALGARAAKEGQDAAPCLRGDELQQARRGAQRGARAAQRAVVLRDGPAVDRELLDQRRQRELGVRERLDVAVGVAHEARHHLGRDLGRSSEDEGPREVGGAAQVVQLHRGAEGDEGDVGLLGQLVNGPQHRVAHVLGLGLRVDARVDDEDEDGRRDLHRLDVLDHGVAAHELGGEVVLRHARVVRREGVAREADAALPRLGAMVDDALRVEHGAARARERGVVKFGGFDAQGRHEGAERNHHARRVDAVHRERPPRPAHRRRRRRLLLLLLLLLWLLLVRHGVVSAAEPRQAPQ